MENILDRLHKLPKRLKKIIAQNSLRYGEKALL